MRGKSMQYAVLCYNYESVVGTWSKEKDDAVMASHGAVMQKFAARRKLGPVARLMPTTTATTVRSGREAVVLDGPFAETKEQLLGFYIFEADSLEEVIQAAKDLLEETGALEIRPVQVYFPAPVGK
jgi:hypothetical protein